MTEEELDTLFGSHELSADATANVDSVRFLSRAYAQAVARLVPPGRKLSQFKTHAENACTAAIKGIALRSEEV